MPFAAPGLRVSMPPFLGEIVATLSHLARQSPHVNQRSGVSVRLTVANRETLVANAARRALRLGETDVVPRIADLDALASSTQGKIEIETRRRGARRPGRRAPPEGGGADGVPRPAPDRAAPTRARGVRRRRGRAHRRRRRRGRRGRARRAASPRSASRCSSSPAATSRPPPSPARSSSCSRACTCRSGSTRTPSAARPPTAVVDHPTLTASIVAGSRSRSNSPLRAPKPTLPS